MPKKSIYWGMLILFLFSTVATAGYFDEDEDDQDAGSVAETVVPENSGGSETAVTENSLKTWKRAMSASVKNGKAVSPDNEIKVETESEIETGDNGKGFWRVEESISFSFHLPDKASVRVKCALNDEYTGKAMIQWNGKALRDENGKRKVYTFDGSDDVFEISDLKTDRKENTLTFVCTDGEIGLESVTIYADIEYPSVTINEMIIQLTSPRPGVPLNGKPVPIRWEEVTSGLADGGWVRILYRTSDTADWQVVPGLEGVTYGAENWGAFTWENPPKAQSCEFKIEYTRGKNPEDKRRAEEAKKRQAIIAATKKLIQTKKKFFDETEELIPDSVFKDLKEFWRRSNNLKARLDFALEDEEKMDIGKVVEYIDELEQIYINMFQKTMEIAPALGEKDREEIQKNVEKFMNKLEKEFTNAQVRYGEDEYTKELLPKMFPKERFTQFKTAKKEFDYAMELLARVAGTRRVWTVNGVEFAFRWCPAGTFMMGSSEDEKGRDDDEKQHQVTLTKGFWMMETEVTQKQWKAVMGTNPSWFKGDDLPVEQVSWNDCQKFCKKCTQLGLPVQLPTEAQWEYACRAGTTGAHAGNLNDMAWYGYELSNEQTHPVGTKKPNAWGLYDMHGNVWELCADYWKEEYPSWSVTDPTGPSNGSRRVSRGGGWDNGAVDCRSAFRYYFEPGYRGSILGFRVLRGQ